MAADPQPPRGELQSVFGPTPGNGSGVTSEQVYEPVASASAGIWRIRAGEQTAILKLIAHSSAGNPNWRSGTDPNHWYFWRREALAYETGLLEQLTGGLRAPTCHLVAPRGDGSVALWLEDVGDPPATAWPVEHYEVAARHLGRAQGAFLTGVPLPDHDWLSHDWLRSYLLQRDGDNELLDQEHLWADPRVAPWCTSAPAERLRAMRRDQSQFLATLDSLPRTLCHLDLHPANLFGDNDTTVAIDWSFVGIGAIGEDAGNLVADAVLDFHVDPAHIHDLYELISSGYAAGLRDTGWRDPGSVARLAVVTSIAAKYAWIGPAMLRAVAENREQLNRRPIDESLRWWAPAVSFLLDCADEARALISDR